MREVKVNLKAKFFGMTDTGKVRKNNEDSFLIDDNLNLAIVADGMGGHNSGELASQIAVKVVKEKFMDMNNTSLKPQNYNEKFELHTNQLAFATQLANSIIYETGNATPENKGMGTTLTAVLFKNDKLSIVHIGDSRVYLFRDNSLYQISQDHSLVMDQVRRGIITKEQAEKSPLQNILTRAMGTQKNVEVDVSEISIKENDKILLCTDGLFKCVKEDTIIDIIKNKKDLKEIIQKLIEIANENGGPDNITVIIGEFTKKSFKEKIKDMVEKINI